MKSVKSYTSIWSVKGVIRSISDIRLPFAIPYDIALYFCITLIITFLFRDVPPLSFIDNGLMLYLCIPAFFAWFLTRKSLDGKRPHKFLMGAFAYLFRKKNTCMGKPIKYGKERQRYVITAVTAIDKEVAI